RLRILPPVRSARDCPRGATPGTVRPRERKQGMSATMPATNEHVVAITQPSVGRAPYRPTYARPTWRSSMALTAAVMALATAPFFLAPYATTTLTRMLIYALLAASLDLLVGLTGLPSLGHAAYFGVGAYAAGWVTAHVTRTAPTPLLAAAVAGALAA